MGAIVSKVTGSGFLAVVNKWILSSMIKGEDATPHEVGRRFLHLKAEADTAGSLPIVFALPQ